MEAAGPPAAAATATATATGGDWRSQIDPLAREVMVKQIFKTLRWHLPMSDEEGHSRHQKLAEGYELRFYNEATNKDSYKRKIAMLLIYVENMNQNSHHQVPELPPQGNDPAQSSGVPLMSQQQIQQPKTSTSVQDSYLPSLGQSLTGVGQAFTLQNMSGQSTIPHMQLMGTQSAIQSGTKQNPLNIGQQPMQSLSLCLQSPEYLEGQLRHPQLSMNQQPSLQWTRLTQEPSFPLQQQQQESMGQQPNLHQVQLICQQNSAVDMPQQHRLPVQSICLNPLHPDNNDVLVPHFSTENFGNFGFAVSPGSFCAEHVASLFPGNEIVNEQEDWDAFLSSLDSGTQMENSEDEVTNLESMADGAANWNKRKFDHI